MNRIFRTLDLLLGLALSASLAMAVGTALPGAAQAAELTIGSGKASTEQRTLSEFNAISASGNFEVRIRQTPQQSVNLRADDNLMALIETVVEGNKTLQIRWKPTGTMVTRTRPTVDIGVPQVQALASAGSSDLRAENLKAPQLAASVSGSGEIRLGNLQGEQLVLSIAGSGDIQASGQVNRFQVKIAGSGDVRADGLKAEDVSVNIAGSGDAAVRAERTLNVSIAGSGDVTYSGSATVKSSIAGSGDVRKR